MQNMESTWWQVKQTLPSINSRHDGRLLFVFGEFLYRRYFQQEPHLFVTCLRHCAEVYIPT